MRLILKGPSQAPMPLFSDLRLYSVTEVDDAVHYHVYIKFFYSLDPHGITFCTWKLVLGSCCYAISTLLRRDQASSEGSTRIRDWGKHFHWHKSRRGGFYPRFPLIPSDRQCHFERLWFLVKLCCGAMTINTV